ncbi:hypothetical protein KGF57_000308 [Candida theae]|uniref:Uncharacterized protein n=1 Tax=Candida theae TaxID=1198502 RepID=A0AAD5G102_9ASCO|nr:uncharacterized protein KGF57_000308 [Candida theae]KAI5967614.1 hypothetical protein KGF57_000308 [Candida theae]
MSSRASSQYTKNPPKKEQDNHNVSSSSFINSTQLESLHRTKSNSKGHSFDTINSLHDDFSLSNTSSVLKSQDAEDVANWIDKIKARYESLRSKQRQELDELLLQKKEEDRKRKLKAEMQRKHFDKDFAKLGKILQQREAEETRKKEAAAEALLQAGSSSENAPSSYPDQLPHWAHHRKEERVDEEDDDVEEIEIEIDSSDQGEAESGYSQNDEEDTDMESAEVRAMDLGVSENSDGVIEIASSSEADEESQNESYNPSSTSNQQHSSHHGYGNDLHLYQTAHSALTYAPPSAGKIDSYGDSLSYATQEHTTGDVYQRTEYNEEGEYEEYYNVEEEYEDERYEQEYADKDNRSPYQPERNYAAYDPKISGRESIRPHADDNDGQKIDSELDYESDEEEGEDEEGEEEDEDEEGEEEDEVEVESPFEKELITKHDDSLEEDLQLQKDVRFLNNESEYDEFKSIIQGNDYKQTSRVEVDQSSGESSMDSGIESLDYGEYASIDANFPKHNVAPASANTRSLVSPHLSESEDLRSNLDSQAEGFADEEEDNEENDYPRNAPSNAYNILKTIKSFGDRSLHNFKEAQTQSGYMADAEYTDNNLPKHSKDDDADSDAHLSHQDYRPGELAPVPDPFYAQELSEQRMKVNDLDENRSEGSLADESQYESHRSEAHHLKEVQMHTDDSESLQKKQVASEWMQEKLFEPVPKSELPCSVQANNAKNFSDECPPEPIFKSIEEEDDPVVVLQNLKEAEKKYNIKIDAVEELENTIRSFSEPPEEPSDAKSVYERDSNISGDSISQTEATRISVPVLESIEADSSSGSSFYDSNSLGSDEMEIDEGGGGDEVGSDSGALSEEQNGIDGSEVDEALDLSTQNVSFGDELVGASAESAEKNVPNSEREDDEMSAKLQTNASGDQSGEIMSTVAPGGDNIDISKHQVSEEVDRDDIDPPYLDSIHETTFATENDESMRAIDESKETNSYDESNDDVEELLGVIAPQAKVLGIEEEELQPGPQSGEIHENITNIEELVNIGDGSESEKEGFTLNKEDGIGAGINNSNINDEERADSYGEQNNVTKTASNDKGSVDDGRVLVNASDEEKIGQESVYALQQDPAPSFENINHELVQDVIDLAYRLAENDEMDREFQEKSFNGSGEFFDSRAQRSEPQTASVKTNEASLANPSGSVLNPSEVRKRLFSIFPNVGPSVRPSGSVRVSLSDEQGSSDLDDEDDNVLELATESAEVDDGDGNDDDIPLRDSSGGEEETTPNSIKSETLSIEAASKFFKKVLRGDYFRQSHASESTSSDGENEDSTTSSEEDEEIQNADSLVDHSDIPDNGSNVYDMSQIDDVAKALTNEEVVSIGSSTQINSKENGSKKGSSPEETGFEIEKDSSSPSVLQVDEPTGLFKDGIGNLVNTVSDFVEKMDDGGSEMSDTGSDEVDKGNVASQSTSQVDQSDFAHDLASAVTHFVEEIEEGGYCEDVSESSGDNSVDKRVTNPIKFADFASRRLHSFSKIAKKLEGQLLRDEVSDERDDEAISKVEVEITYTRPSTRRRRRRKSRRHGHLQTSTAMVPVRNPDVTLSAPVLEKLIEDESTVIDANHSDELISDEDKVDSSVELTERTELEEGSRNAISSLSGLSSQSPISHDQVEEETIQKTSQGFSIVGSDQQHDLSESPAPRLEQTQATLESIARLDPSTPSLVFEDPAPTIHRLNPSKRRSRSRKRRILGLHLSEIANFGALENSDESGGDNEESEENSRGRISADLPESLRHSSAVSMNHPASRTRSKSPLKKKRKLE